MKKKIIIGASVVAVALLGFFAYRKYGNPFASGASPQGAQSAEYVQAAGSSIPSFTPTSYAYQPFIPATGVSLPTGRASAPPPTITGGSDTISGAGCSVCTTISDTVASLGGHQLTDTEKMIDSDYLQSFGRHAEAAGLAYWANFFTNTDTLHHNADYLLNSIVAGAQGTDKTVYAASHQAPTQTANVTIPSIPGTTVAAPLPPVNGGVPPVNGGIPPVNGGVPHNALGPV